MSISWTTVLNVILALAIFKVLDALFLDDLLSSVVSTVGV
jgi:hypothetical protein